MNLDDTIAAIATPRGEGGIGIIRVSGPLAIPIATQIFRPANAVSPNKLSSHTLTHGHIIDAFDTDEVVDEVLLGIMCAPKSYTTEDIVEFNCHGGTAILTTVLDLIVKAGARLAEPGEFTKRAFLNGRLDLAQAEAVAELISSKTELNRKIAIDTLAGKLSKKVNQISDNIASLLAEIEASIDFPDEELDFMKIDIQLKNVRAIQENIYDLLKTANEGRLINDGVKIAILGKPNVGKSSLFNALVQTSRAIVTHIPGTTRDTIDETINLDGLPIILIDTAGLRQTEDIVEQQGVERSRKVLNIADFLIIMFDASQPLNDADKELMQIANSHRAILVLNKIDLPKMLQTQELTENCPKLQTLQTAITDEIGIDTLKAAIREELLGPDFTLGESPIVTNARHHDAFRRAHEALKDVIDSLENDMPPDLVTVDLRISLDALGDIVGKTTTEDILDRIFSQFCVGK